MNEWINKSYSIWINKESEMRGSKRFDCDTYGWMWVYRKKLELKIFFTFSCFITSSNVIAEDYLCVLNFSPIWNFGFVKDGWMRSNLGTIERIDYNFWGNRILDLKWCGMIDIHMDGILKSLIGRSSQVMSTLILDFCTFLILLSLNCSIE